MSKQATHGESYSRTYNIWALMRQRCSNPNAANYIWYGGRGIQCCAQWREFAVFLREMGHPPGQAFTLDRVDPNGDYTPENCRWADPETQACNRRNGVKLTVKGETLSLSQWCRRTGLTRDEINHRVRVLGMTPEQAMESPKMSWVQRPVRCTSLDGLSVQRFDSLADAARATGIVKGSLWAALKRCSPVVFSGSSWEYVDTV
jgi:hypothetical protein